jgi:lipopolysaccharide assembly protein A
MQIFVFLALIIAVIAVIFAVQNTLIVTVSFLMWKFNGSLALVLLLAIAVGALISFLASSPTLVRGKWSLRSHRKRAADLENSLNASNQRVAELESSLNTSTQRVTELESSLVEQKKLLEETQRQLQALTPPAQSPQASALPPDQPKPTI